MRLSTRGPLYISALCQKDIGSACCSENIPVNEKVGLSCLGFVHDEFGTTKINKIFGSVKLTLRCFKFSKGRRFAPQKLYKQLSKTITANGSFRRDVLVSKLQVLCMSTRIKMKCFENLFQVLSL